MELDRFETEMLDAVLEAFGDGDRLTRNQLLDLFALDEEMAGAVIAILAGDGYVTEYGLTEEHPLPEIVVRQPKGLRFLKDGGYTALLEPVPVAPPPPEPDDRELRLAALQQENLGYQLSLREREQKIIKLELKLKQHRMLQYAVVVLIIIVIVLIYWVSHLSGHHLHTRQS